MKLHPTNRPCKIFCSILAAFLVLPALCLVSCGDDNSYSKLLDKETAAVNNFLADHRVINEIPADTVFEYGPDAPYYRLDEDGQLYMQVIEPGTKGDKAVEDQLIYFRFTRYNLASYKDGKLPDGQGNEADLTSANSSFRFGNFSIPTSSQWGSGLQTPLMFLPIDCTVNLVIKSQVGLSEETSYVNAYLYNVRYYKADY